MLFRGNFIRFRACRTFLRVIRAKDARTKDNGGARNDKIPSTSRARRSHTGSPDSRVSSVLEFVRDGTLPDEGLPTRRFLIPARRSITIPRDSRVTDDIFLDVPLRKYSPFVCSVPNAFPMAIIPRHALRDGGNESADSLNFQPTTHSASQARAASILACYAIINAGMRATERRAMRAI